MGMDAKIDVRMQAALARLTANEKECLRRRLLQQTAKEMALDLGISPHAVEKRLKMARTKLGLSSSLEAARLLLASERYQRAGPHPADLETTAPPRQKRLTSLFVIGGFAMSIFAVVMIALAAQVPSSEGVAPLDVGEVTPPSHGSTASTQVPKDEQGRPTTANGRSVTYVTPPADLVTPTPTEIAMVVTTSFSVADQDHSGFIEASETPVRGDADIVRKIYDRDDQGHVTDTGRTVTVTAERARAQYIEMADKDGDGKLDFAEYRAWMAPNVAKNGIPAAWREDIEQNYRAAAD